MVSDWGAVNERVAGIRAGLHLEMTTSLGPNDRAIVAAVRAGELDEARLDVLFRTLLTGVNALHVRQCLAGPPTRLKIIPRPLSPCNRKPAPHCHGSVKVIGGVVLR